MVDMREFSFHSLSQVRKFGGPISLPSLVFVCFLTCREACGWQ
jgi:hypothetical protein